MGLARMQGGRCRFCRGRRGGWRRASSGGWATCAARLWMAPSHAFLPLAWMRPPCRACPPPSLLQTRPSLHVIGVYPEGSLFIYRPLVTEDDALPFSIGLLLRSMAQILTESSNLKCCCWWVRVPSVGYGSKKKIVLG